MTVLITVYNTYVTPQNNPASGTVTFTPRVAYITQASSPLLMGGIPTSVKLDVNGSISVQLQATDDTNITPQGWSYEVQENLNGVPPRTYDIRVPAASSGGMLNLAVVAPVSTAVTGFVAAFDGPQGPQGVAGPAGADGPTGPPGPSGGTPVTTTIAGLNALATGGSLVVGTKYIVTDWTASPALPGPNLLIVDALDANTPSSFVLVETPVAFGPSDGDFSWSFGFMGTLRDVLGNEIIDLGAGMINNFPWGGGWTNNKISQSTFPGGYAHTSAAATAGAVFNNNILHGCTIDFGATPNSQSNIANNILEAVNISAGANNAVIAIIGCQTSGGGDLGANITGGAVATPGAINLFGVAFGDATITVSGTGDLTIRRCALGGQCSVTNSGAGILTVLDSAFSGITTINQAAAAQPFTVQRCSGISGDYENTVTGASGVELVHQCRVDNSSISFTGAAGGRTVADCSVTGNSAINITESASSTGASNAAINVTVEAQGTLNVSDQGSYSAGRVAAGAILNTANFNHANTIIDGGFTVTLTAANTNKLKNSLGSNVI